MIRRVVVTGSGSGIGRSLAALLRERGDEVIGVDLRDAEVIADLSTPAGREAAIGAVRERSGGVVDAIVTCAGTSIPGELMVTLNFFGSIRLVEGLRAELAASASPRVALVGSISGTQPHAPDVVAACLGDDEEQAVERARETIAAGRAQQLYPSSKSAIAQWARRTCVAPGWADAGIAVNVVAPGVVLTPMTDGLFADERMRKVMDQAVPMPLNGYAEPEAIAEVLGFVVSPLNTHMTGQVIYVDGGAEATLRPADHY